MIIWFEKHSTISWIITILIAGIIFYLSSQTFEGPLGGKSYFSVIYHFLAFFIFSFFLLISLIQGKINKPLLITGIFLAIIYGISDEFHQMFTPGRSSSVSDLFINSAGILTASTIYSVHCIRCNHRISKNIIF